MVDGAGEQVGLLIVGSRGEAASEHEDILVDTCEMREGARDLSRAQLGGLLLGVGGIVHTVQALNAMATNRCRKDGYVRRKHAEELSAIICGEKVV